jgi:hypothetical protein
MQWFEYSQEPKPGSRTRHRLDALLLLDRFLSYYVMMIYLLFFSHSETGVHFLGGSLVAGELALMAGLFLLGGQFWERLQHLY